MSMFAGAALGALGGGGMGGGGFTGGAATSTSGDAANRSTNIVGSSGYGGSSLNELIALTQGSSTNGGLSFQDKYGGGLRRESTALPIVPIALIGGIVLIAILLLKK